MVKRMSVVFTGALMLGATAMGALAADLNDYPNMFVDNGVFDGYFVVGENAASVDNLAMTDIAASMKISSGGTVATSLEGDTWLVATSTNILEFNDDISDVESYITDGDLGALADGSVTNEKGTSNYEQFLHFDDSYIGLTYEEDEDNNLGAFYKIPSGTKFARYVLDFTSTFDSDIDSSSNLEDFEDEVINVLGKEWTIVQAKNDSAGTPELTLMGGSTSDTLQEGDEGNYLVGDVDYTVSLQSVAAYSSVNKAKFVINGELTTALADGDTDKLSDGTVIGVTDITYQNYAGGIHAAKFFIGANKLKLHHNNNLEVNDETINDASVRWTFTTTGSDLQLDQIDINMSADDDFFLASGEKLSEDGAMDEPQVLFGQNWDIEFQGLSTEDSSPITIVPSGGDSEYDLTFENSEGTTIKVPLVFANTSGLYLGEKTGRELILNATYNNVTRNQYFFLNDKAAATTSNDARSYLLQYTGRDGTDDTDPKVTFKNIGTGETLTRTLASTGTFDIKLGGTTFNGRNGTLGTTDNDPVQLTSSQNGAIRNVSTSGHYLPARNASVGFSLRTKNNGWIKIENTNATLGTTTGHRVGMTDARLFVDLITDDDDRKDDLTGTDENVSVSFSFTEADTEVDSQVRNGNMTFWVSDPEESTVTKGYQNYGTFVKETNPSGSSRTIEIDVPEAQVGGNLYVTSGSTVTASSASGGSMVAVEVVDATKLDSEVADAMAQNLIVVGGPCVNTVAAELLGNPVDCTEGFTPGKARVKLFENGESVAMLVAGYSGADTRLAGKVIAQRYSELSGDEVEIEGTTTADATIGAPTVVEEVMEEVVEPEVEAEQ